MEFTIGNEIFNPCSLLGKGIDDVEVQRMIREAKKLGESYTVHKPMKEDIHYPTDDWECHDAEGCGVIFEFLQNRLLYIALRSNACIVNYNHWKSNQVKITELKYGNYTFQILSDYSRVFNEDNLPNRYSPINEAILLK